MVDNVRKGVLLMNVFSGSRRIAIVAGAVWVFSWVVAAALNETKVRVRYDYIVGSNFANFAGFDLYSCPQKTDKRSLEIKTDSGHPVAVTLCIYGSKINLPEGFVLEPFDADAYLSNKQSSSGNGLAPNSIEVSFSDGTSHVYANLREQLTSDKIIQQSKKDFPNKEVAKVIGQGIDWVDYEALAKSFGGVTNLEQKKKIALANASARLHEKNNSGIKEPQSNPFDIFDERTISAAFKIRDEDQGPLNEKWWESWRSTYARGSVAMLSGLVALLVFSIATGWIVRGFLGIPKGMDSKQKIKADDL
jgi:hypothetical protein